MTKARDLAWTIASGPGAASGNYSRGFWWPGALAITDLQQQAERI
jgi:hypothetical protein